MAVTGGEMQRGVIATVHDVNTRAAHDEHVHNAAPTLPARPVEGAESMVVTETTLNKNNESLLWDSCVVLVRGEGTFVDADEERLCQHNSFMQCFHCTAALCRFSNRSGLYLDPNTCSLVLRVVQTPSDNWPRDKKAGTA